MHSDFFYLFSLKILVSIPHLYLYIENVCPGYVESGHSFFFIIIISLCVYDSPRLRAGLVPLSGSLDACWKAVVLQHCKQYD